MQIGSPATAATTDTRGDRNAAHAFRQGWVNQVPESLYGRVPGIAGAYFPEDQPDGVGWLRMVERVAQGTARLPSRCISDLFPLTVPLVAVRRNEIMALLRVWQHPH